MDFIDWLECYQDFDFELPIISKDVMQKLDLETGEQGIIIQPRFTHKGSFCSSISIKISGQRITVSGNPSKYNRIDNLFGLTSLDECFSVYNYILLSLGLPPFTKCTQVFQRQGVDGSKISKFANGAVIRRIDITTNVSTGGYSRDYIRGISSQRYRNSEPRLHTNGFTCDWLSARGNANLIYPIVYDKANELSLHSLIKIKNKYGVDSSEFRYLNRVIDYCKQHGVCRFEQKFKSRYLQKHNMNYWGLFDVAELFEKQREFLAIDEKIGVNAMDIETISENLISNNIVTSTKAANITAIYAIEWAHGKTFDFTKSQVKIHRSRLRKIGIDIKNVFDASRFSPVVVVKSKEIHVSSLTPPSWYQRPDGHHLRLVA